MIIINLFYTGKDDSAYQFAKEMLSSGLVTKIRNLPGNLGYDYYVDLEDRNTILLVDKWEDQKALDNHHDLNMLKIAKLREKYHLTVKAKRYDTISKELGSDEKYLK